MPVEPVTPPTVTGQVPLPVSPSGGRSSSTYAAWQGADIQDDLMDACAALFSNNYGIWGGQSPQKKGSCIRLFGTSDLTFLACRETCQDVWLSFTSPVCLKPLSDRIGDMLPGA